jgi:hypothetical protein
MELNRPGPLRMSSKSSATMLTVTVVNEDPVRGLLPNAKIDLA